MDCCGEKHPTVNDGHFYTRLNISVLLLALSLYLVCFACPLVVMLSFSHRLPLSSLEYIHLVCSVSFCFERLWCLPFCVSDWKLAGQVSVHYGKLLASVTFFFFLLFSSHFIRSQTTHNGDILSRLYYLGNILSKWSYQVDICCYKKSCIPW